jgi:hypothetical protein
MYKKFKAEILLQQQRNGKFIDQIQYKNDQKLLFWKDYDNTLCVKIRGVSTGKIFCVESVRYHQLQSADCLHFAILLHYTKMQEDILI